MKMTLEQPQWDLLDTMKELIAFRRCDKQGGDLYVAAWLAVVPEVYRDKMIELCIQVGDKYLGKKISGETLEDFINELYGAMSAFLEEERLQPAN